MPCEACATELADSVVAVSLYKEKETVCVVRKSLSFCYFIYFDGWWGSVVSRHWVA